MNTRKVRTKQYVVEFPVTGVLETDKETAQVAAKIIESLHLGASFGIPAGGGWSIETIWSVKHLAWMAFAGLVIHGLLVCAGLMYHEKHIESIILGTTKVLLEHFYP